MLDAMKIRDAARVYEQYPHEMSGGMGQRVMIAMMLLADPDLVIADEPTSALDVTVRLQVLSILDGLVRDRGIGLIMISQTSISCAISATGCSSCIPAGSWKPFPPAIWIRRDTPIRGAFWPPSRASAAHVRRLRCWTAAPNGWRRNFNGRFR